MDFDGAARTLTRDRGNHDDAGMYVLRCMCCNRQHEFVQVARSSEQTELNFRFCGSSTVAWLRVGAAPSSDLVV